MGATGATGPPGPPGSSGSISGIVWEPSDMSNFAQIGAPSASSYFCRRVICKFTFTILKCYVYCLSSGPSVGIGIYNTSGALICYGYMGAAGSALIGYNFFTMTAAPGQSLTLTAGTQYIVAFYGQGLGGTAMLAQTISTTNIPNTLLYAATATIWPSVVPFIAPATIATSGNGAGSGYTIWYAFSNVL
jgi:hypothetical protein